MRVWGFGHNPSGSGENDKSKLFIKYGFVSLGWEKHDEFYELISNMEKGDLIYLKKWFPRQGDIIEINAIGIVKATDYDTTAIQDESLKGHKAVAVAWIKDFSDNPVRFMPNNENWRKGINRFNSIYLETKEEILDNLIELLDINQN